LAKPALIVANGEVLIESAAILDYLDEIVGPSRALLPVAGEPRRRCLRILASATAACDKAIAISYERRRSSERIFVDWIARCWTLLDAALAELDSFKRLSWPIHDRSMAIKPGFGCRSAELLVAGAGVACSV
jgi:glutathione S-transferase